MHVCCLLASSCMGLLVWLVWRVLGLLGPKKPDKLDQGRGDNLRRSSSRQQDHKREYVEKGQVLGGVGEDLCGVGQGA